MSARHTKARRRSLLGGIAAVTALGLALVLWWQPLAVMWHHHRARHFLRANQDRRALDQLQKALAILPDGAETQLLLARTQRRLTNLQSVPALLKRAEELGGDPERVQRERWLLWAQSGRLAEAEPHLLDLLMDPRDDGPDICRSFVLAYLADFRAGEAARLLEAWEKEYPRDSQAHFMRGYMMAALEKKPDAVEAYRQGLEIAPDQTAMRCRLAYLLMDSGELDEAGEHLRRCLGEEPRSPDVLLCQAAWLSARNEVEQAAEVLQRLLDMAPDEFEARRQLGLIEVRRGRFQEALRHLEPAAKQRPYDKQCRYLLGSTLRALGRNAEAKPHLDYVDEAAEPLDRVERQMLRVPDHPLDAQLRYEIGCTLLKYGPPHEGVAWLQSVLHLEPDHAGAHQTLADYYEARGDSRKALFHRRRGRGE